jgi:hypothetical protein
MSHWQKLEKDNKKDTGTVADHRASHHVGWMEMNWVTDRTHMVDNHNFEGTCKNHHLHKHPARQLIKQNVVNIAHGFSNSVASYFIV